MAKYKKDLFSEISAKRDQMRSKSRSQSKSHKLEKEEKDWDLGSGFAARVVEVHKRFAFVSPEDPIYQIDTKDVWLSQMARKYLTGSKQERNFLCVGDRVYCREAREKEKLNQSELPQCVVEHISPRLSKISRVDPMNKNLEHVLASNINRLIIVASVLSPTVKFGLVDRYLTLAENQRLEATIVLTKIDLLKDKPQHREECERRAEYYRSIGYDVIMMQTIPEISEGVLEKLSTIFEGSISLLSGHSGVGKSTLINLFEPEIVQEVEANAQIFYKGRHTTSYSSFIKLGCGGYAIDSPGVRSFVTEITSAIELTHGFREFLELSSLCKFRGCHHHKEPECAVKAAVEKGDIPDWRYSNYIGILTGDSGREGKSSKGVGEDGF